MGSDFAWKSTYWKFGELKQISKLARVNLSRVRFGKSPISMNTARVIELAGRAIGKDLTAQDWFDASRGLSDHIAFDEIYGNSELWGGQWED